MGDMSGKRSRRVEQLETELALLEAIKKPTLSQKHRVARIKSAELPKAQRNKAGR